MFPAVALALLFCPFPLQVVLSSLRSPLQLTNLDRGLLLYARQYVNTPWTQGPHTYCPMFPAVALALLLLPLPLQVQLFRPFTSPLLCFTGPLPSFMRPLPSSQVPSYLSRSSFIFTGPVLSFTGPLPFSRVPFHFHGSPSIFTGPLPFSRVPSSPGEVCVGSLCQGGVYTLSSIVMVFGKRVISMTDIIHYGQRD